MFVRFVVDNKAPKKGTRSFGGLGADTDDDVIQVAEPETDAQRLAFDRDLAAACRRAHTSVEELVATFHLQGGSRDQGAVRLMLQQWMAERTAQAAAAQERRAMHQRLQGYARARGRVVRDVSGSGDCLFEASGLQLGVSGHGVRARCVEKLRGDVGYYFNSEDFVMPEEEVNRRLVEYGRVAIPGHVEGGWGDERCIRAIADTYETRIVVVNSWPSDSEEGLELPYEPRNRREHQPEIVLGYLDGLHYVSLERALPPVLGGGVGAGPVVPSAGLWSNCEDFPPETTHVSSEHLLHALQASHAVAVCADCGTGKSTAIEEVLETLDVRADCVAVACRIVHAKDMARQYQLTNYEEVRVGQDCEGGLSVCVNSLGRKGRIGGRHIHLQYRLHGLTIV